MTAMNDHWAVWSKRQCHSRKASCFDMDGAWKMSRTPLGIGAHIQHDGGAASL
jgi:hypothetical protein